MKKCHFCAVVMLVTSLLIGVSSCSKKEEKSDFEKSLTTVSKDLEKTAKEAEKEVKKAAKKAEKDLKKAKAELEKQLKD